MFSVDVDQQQIGTAGLRSLLDSKMPGGSLKAEVGRTERAATRRNKIFTSQMRVDVKEIDRSMRIAMRQIELQRQGLYAEMDNLESRSGWLRDTELASLPGGAVVAQRRVSALSLISDIDGDSLSEAMLTGRDESSAGGIRTAASRRSHARTATGTTRTRQDSAVGNKEDEVDKLKDSEQHLADLLIRSHTEIANSINKHDGETRRPSIIRSADVGGRSLGGARARPSSQVRFKPASLADAETNIDDIFDKTYSIREEPESVTPTRSFYSAGRRSSSLTRHDSATLSEGNRRKSLLYIPANDPRYHLVNITVNSIDVKKIREHARASQKLRFEGKNAMVKKQKKGDGTGVVEIGGEYVPKRVLQMREERLRMRQTYQETYNQDLIDNAISKFKEMYVVPGGGGLSEAKEFISDL